ncbi:hypothetical protein [Metabacillus fastidiosus]|uniref:hypothetical protein n=1 Tax=Metabacillus fastidiosus TaxID=1458 RepID=UPI003D2DE49F
MEKVNWKEIDIKPHNIVVAWTSSPDYEMNRMILLEISYSEYILLEGWHCSCYDFDETEWEAIKYTEEELRSIANADYNKNNRFWKQVKEQLE